MREVGGEVCCEGAAERVADYGEGGPGEGRGLEAEEDLGCVEGGGVLVVVGGGGGGVAAAEEICGGLLIGGLLWLL